MIGKCEVCGGDHRARYCESKPIFDSTGDPRIDARNEGEAALVVELCSRLGYGFVMQAASLAWQQVDPLAAIVTGPAKTFTRPCNCTSPGRCDLCYGCGWRFKRKGER